MVAKNLLKKTLIGIVLSASMALCFNPSRANEQNIPAAIYEQTEYGSFQKDPQALRCALEDILNKEPNLREYMPLIEAACKKYENIYKVDPLLVVALLKAETYKFDKYAISSAAAAGLAQIIPETAALYGIKAYNPEYLKQAREDRRTALSYYNKLNQELNNPGKGEKYIIQKGDTLSSIAKSKDRTIDELLDANPKLKDNPNLLMENDEITIPYDEEESIKRMIEYKKQYQHYNKKSQDAFKRYKQELIALTQGKTDEELKEIDGRLVPEIAIDFCVKHLADLMKARNGDIREAISAYNAGLRAVDVYGGIPPYDETVKYQNKIINYYRDYLALLKK
ncbi:LysM peptidoglycan-binding domain-containing protein [Candidatus Woesearchaeota archaeon]|nr:LysM peptidoglycan-binding domain-containing protein [Candidatus Woesearchaeota archaeon]